jgi:hypothetical protein
MELYDSEGNLVHIEEQKQSLWARIGAGSLIFAALFHAILLIIGAFWIFQIIQEPEKKVDFMPPGGGGGERGADVQVQQKKRAQIIPTTNVKRVFAEGAASSYAIPEQGDNFGEMSQLSSLSGGGMSGGLGGSGSGTGFGSGSGSGSGLGFGGGSGKLFGLIPENMRKRCSKEDRLERLKANGGTPACEDAVMKALRWLKKTQNADGSWGDGSQPAMTGLALLAYFGHCETPLSDEFGQSCLDGIVWLVNTGMKNDGKLASNFTENGWVYEHGIATYAIGEAATFCKDLKIDVPNLLEIAEKAGQYIIDNQNSNGGWAYRYEKSGGATDVSISGWQIQALKACDHTGIRYRGMTGCINKGLVYIDEQQASNGGYGYNSKELHGGLDYYTLTGVGMLCNQMWGKGNRRSVKKGASYVLENTKFDYNSEFSDLYGHYYESQAMMQIGGKDWDKYNSLMRDQLLNNQNDDGSWKQPGGGKGIRGVATVYAEDNRNGIHYRTTLCTLMLEVYYRFLNTDSGGGFRSRPGI